MSQRAHVPEHSVQLVPNRPVRHPEKKTNFAVIYSLREKCIDGQGGSLYLELVSKTSRKLFDHDKYMTDNRFKNINKGPRRIRSQDLKRDTNYCKN